MKLISNYIFKRKKIKIGIKKLSYFDIDIFNEESIDFFSPIVPKIYEQIKKYPEEFDLLIGYYEEKFDWYDDSIILIRENKIFTIFDCLINHLIINSCKKVY